MIFTPSASVKSALAVSVSVPQDSRESRIIRILRRVWPSPIHRLPVMDFSRDFRKEGLHGIYECFAC
jgi:hypothetical protein